MRTTGARKLTSLPKRKADFIEPMDCAPVSKLPDGPQWLFEIKLDGYRTVAVKSDRGVNLFSRRHKSFNHQYQHLFEALGQLPEGMARIEIAREIAASKRAEFYALAAPDASRLRHHKTDVFFAC